ncbi:uncharacterized protein [Rutidosis leptorrhynchoides]|uniref:uncharacterized protein n=1 Tax=Rutidosis leptorrhynchoides TaxID=125765 RepID=UPI003A9A4F28
MPWVKWDTILGPFESGGLKAKNLALLGKWWWRFRIEKDAFWVQVIKSIHGRDGGLGLSGSNHTCNNGSTWNGIINLNNELMKFDINFANPLNSDENATVAARITKHNDSWEFSWDWCRDRGRSLTELHSLINLFADFKYGKKEKDTWAWSMQSNGTFSTSLLTELVNKKLLQPNIADTETLPEKIGVFIWRALRNMLPVRKELDKRGIDLDSVRCPICDNDIPVSVTLLIKMDKVDTSLYASNTTMIIER